MQPKSVLVVDDDTSIGAALTTRLAAAGYLPTYAQCGREALVLAERAIPDAVVLDVRMPDIDGLDVCARLRANHATSDVPVIFLTANTTSRERAEAMNALGNAFLPKPYDARLLLATIDRLLNQKGNA